MFGDLRHIQFGVGRFLDAGQELLGHCIGDFGGVIVFATDRDIHAAVDNDLVGVTEFRTIRCDGTDCGVGWSDPLFPGLGFTICLEECRVSLAHSPRCVDVIEVVGKGVRSNSLTVLDGEAQR